MEVLRRRLKWIVVINGHGWRKRDKEMDSERDEWGKNGWREKGR